MCPGTLALVGVGMMAGGQLLGGVMKAENADYQAQVARNNYIIGRQNATHAAQAAAVNTETAGLKARGKNAAVRAGIAANNLDIGSGSAVDVQVSQRELGHLDVEQTANNAARQVYGYEAQAQSAKAEQKLQNSQIVPDLLGGALAAGGTVLSSPAATGAIFGEGGATAGTGAQTFAPGATGMPTSLLSSDPGVPDEYAWMHESQGAVY